MYSRAAVGLPEPANPLLLCIKPGGRENLARLLLAGSVSRLAKATVVARAYFQLWVGEKPGASFFSSHSFFTLDAELLLQGYAAGTTKKQGARCCRLPAGGRPLAPLYPMSVRRLAQAAPIISSLASGAAFPTAL